MGARLSTSLKEKSPELSAQWHPKLNLELTPESVSSGSDRRVWWLCEDGHAWQTAISNRVIGKTGCPQCWALRRASKKERKAPRSKWHPDLNGDKRLEDYTHGSFKLAWWACLTKPEHSWQSRIASYYDGKGCPHCSGKLLKDPKKYLSRTHPHLIKEWAKENTFTPKDVTANSSRKAYWHCSTGNHVYFKRIDHRVQGGGCPEHKKSNTSNVELLLAETLCASRNVKMTSNHLAISWRKSKSMQVDFAGIREDGTKVVVEYDGSYWHRNKTQLDTDKTTALLESGYKVIRVREDDLEFLTLNHPNFYQLRFAYSLNPLDHECLCREIETFLT